MAIIPPHIPIKKLSIKSCIVILQIPYLILQLCTLLVFHELVSFQVQWLSCCSFCLFQDFDKSNQSKCNFFDSSKLLTLTIFLLILVEFALITFCFLEKNGHCLGNARWIELVNNKLLRKEGNNKRFNRLGIALDSIKKIRLGL